jgi:RHS repeat-associated protein
MLDGTTTKMLFDGPNVVQESAGGSLTASLIAGLQVDQLFSRTTSAGTDSYLTDRLGSTIALSDGSGEVNTTYTYEPFGQPSSDGASNDNTFQFTARENDETGMQYSRARYYDPTTARFISPDPLGFEGSGPNLYRYANGDPLGYTDPNGMDPLTSGIGSGVEEGLKEKAAEVGGAVYDAINGTGEVIEDNADIIVPAGVCLVSSGTLCLVVSAASLGLQTRESFENSGCTRRFVELEAVTVGVAAAGSIPGVLTSAGLRAAGESAARLTPAGRAALNVPTLLGPVSGDLVIEPGAQESETSSC